MTVSDSQDKAAAAAASEGRVTRSKSRVGQPLLPPIVFEGRRYEQIDNAERLGLPQRTGYLAVFDNQTNERITNVKVYDVAFNPDKEADVQDVFFTRMQLDEAARKIVIENERGKRFTVDLDGYSVQPQS